LLKWSYFYHRKAIDTLFNQIWHKHLHSVLKFPEIYYGSHCRLGFSQEMYQYNGSPMLQICTKFALNEKYLLQSSRSRHFFYATFMRWMTLRKLISTSILRMAVMHLPTKF